MSTLDPIFTTLVTAAASLGSAVIGTVPDIVKVIAERKNQLKTEDPKLEEERNRLQKELEQLRKQLGTEQLKNRQQLAQPVQNWEQFRSLKELELQVAELNRSTQLAVAETQRKTALQQQEVKTLFENWPLSIVPSQILDQDRNRRNGLRPLRVILSPPRLDRAKENDLNPPDIEPLVSQGLSEFLDAHYSLNDLTRPTEFLGGAWDNKQARREASIKALFSMLNSEPTLVLESELIGGEMVLRVGYWGIGQSSYCYQSIAKIPILTLLRESAKSRAEKWREFKKRLTKERLIKMGGEEALIKMGRDNVENLRLLEQEEELREGGIELSDLEERFAYNISPKDYENLAQTLTLCHCIATAWITDAYHLVHNDTPPQLPKLLSKMTEKITEAQRKSLPILEFVRGVIGGYRMLYTSMSEERPSWVPELSIQLADSLTSLPDKSWAREQAYHSIRAWLMYRRISPSEGDNTLELMQPILTAQDRNYVHSLKKCFEAIGDQQACNKLVDFDWVLTRRQREIESLSVQGRRDIEGGRYREALGKFERLIELDPTMAEAYFHCGYIHLKAGKYASAIRDYDQVIALKPSNARAHVNRGIARYSLGEHVQSVADFECALVLDPNLQEARVYLEKIQGGSG
jgi:tetratricopeptide (TPR) repeat protein